MSASTSTGSGDPTGTLLRPDQAARTFVDPVLDEELREQGYTTFPVLDAEEVAALRSAHRELVGAGGSGMVVDYMSEDRSIMAAFTERLDEVWPRHFPRIFADHRAVFATCVVKYPGPESGMFLHEDRSYVDERRFRAGTLWIPLVDTSPELDNGCLHIVPGSHRLAVTLSGSNTPDLARPYSRALEAALVPVSVPAGHGLFYDTRVLHGSPPNRSREVRPAIACAVAPTEAELIHVVGVDAARRRVFSVDGEFFVNHGPAEVERSMPSTYRVVDEFEDTVLSLDAELVRESCGLVRAPTAETLVPEDLQGVLAGTDRAFASDTPRRVGTLVPVDSSPGGPGAPDEVRASPLAPVEIDEDSWVPASLWPGGALTDWVGDPLLQLLGDRTLAVRLDGGERLGLDLTDWSAARMVMLAGPPVGAGVVGAARAHSLEIGPTVRIAGTDRAVVWNHGPGDLDLVVRFDRGRRRRGRGLAGRRLTRMLGQVSTEVSAAGTVR